MAVEQFSENRTFLSAPCCTIRAGRPFPVQVCPAAGASANSLCKAGASSVLGQQRQHTQVPKPKALSIASNQVVELSIAHTRPNPNNSSFDDGRHPAMVPKVRADRSPSDGPGVHPIPFSYRLILGVIEPLLTIMGGIQLVAFPGSYFSFTSPAVAHRFYPASGTAHTDEDARLLQHLLWQIVGGWATLVLTEVTLLSRSHPRDVKLWRGVHACVLLGSDVCYVIATAQGLTDPSTTGWKAVLAWVDSPAAWATVILTALPFGARLGLVLGLGVKTQTASKQRAE